MSTRSAVILTLDEGAAGKVRRLWRAMADQGIDDHMQALGAEPHVSLSVYEEIEASALLPAVRALAPRFAALPVGFPSLGIFPGDEAILFLAPKVSQALLDLHADYHRLAAGQARHLQPDYAPARWVPHCTVAMHLPAPDLPRAVAAAQAAWSPIAGRLSALALVTFPPMQEIYRHG